MNPGSPWVVPAGVTSVKVEVWGGGGGGGAVYSFGAGGGGGGGSYQTSTLTVVPGDTYTITIGAGGAGGTVSGGVASNGVDGLPTTFTNGTQTVSAPGGKGGQLGNFSAGDGGVGGIGTYNGGAGGKSSSSNGPGGGGGAGNNGAGGNGSETAAGTGGIGNPNAVPYIGGIGGANITSDGDGSPGNAPGGGGGGASVTDFSSGYSGGKGGDGQIVLTFTSISITGFTPTSECANSFTPVTINGSGFTGLTAVSFNGTPAASFSFVNDGQIIATPAPGTTTGTISVTAPGGTVTSSGNFTVNPVPNVTNTFSSPVYCNGVAGAAVTFTSDIAGATFTWTSTADVGFGTGGTGNIGAYTATNTGTTQIIATITVSATANGCPGPTSTYTVTVNPIPTVNVGGAMAAICQGGTSAALGGSFGGGATSAIWSDGGAGGTFTNNGGSTPNTTTYIAAVGSTSPVTLTLTTAGGSCGTTSANKQIVVNPNPSVNVGGGLAAICQGGTSAALGGSFGGGATSAIWSDGGAGGTFTNNGGSTPNTTTYTAAAGSTSPVTLTLTTAGGSCGTTSANKQIVVNPNPIVNVGGAVAAICQGGTSAALGGSFGGGATSAVWSDGGAGGTFTNNGGSTPNTTTYTAAVGSTSPVTLTLTTAGGSCGPISANKQIVVNQNPTVNAGGAMAAICQGGTSAALGGSFGGGATSAVWSAPSGTFANNGGGTPGTATFTAAANSTSPITLTLTTSGGSCGTTSATKTIVVNPNPTANAGGALSAICQGGTSAAMGGSVGGGATGGTWSGGAGTWTNANNPSTATYKAGAAESGLITLTLTTSGGLCGTTTVTKTITVNPNPTVNAGGAMAAICQGGTSAALGGSFGGGATSAVWSAPSGTFANNGGGTPGTATFTAAANSTSPITLTLTTSGGSCGTTSATKTIVVNPNPTANAGGALSAICQGGTSAAMGGSVGGGATGGTWSGGAGTWTNANNPSTATYKAGAAESGPITLTLTTSGGLCGTTTVTKTITVNQNPTANAGGAMAAICQGGTSAALGGSFGGGATSAVWSAPSGTFANNGGGTPGTATFTAAANSTSPITLTLTTSGGSCGTTSATKTIVVNPNPTANAGGALSAICQGGTSAAMGGSVGGGATGGTWSGGAGTWTNANNPSTATYKAGAAESGTITLTLTTSGGLCGTTTVTKTITVNQNPTANAGGAMAAICQGGTSAAMGGSVGGGATGGTWSGGAGTWTNANNPSTATYKAGAAESGTITLTLTTSGGSCGTTTASKTIVVNPNPTVSAGGAMAAICQGGTSAALGGSFGGGATSAVWSDGGAGGTFTNNGGSTPNTTTYTAAGGSSSPVTLTLTTAGGSCGTTSANKQITVKAIPTATAGGSQTICPNGTATVSGASSSNGTISWTENGAGSITAGGTTLTPTYTAAAGDAGRTVTLTMTVSNSPCTAATATYTVFVYSLPTAGNITGTNTTVCIGSTITLTPNAAGTAPFSYNWSSSNTGVATVTPPNTGAVTGVGAGTTNITYTVTDGNGCTSVKSANYPVTVTKPIAGAITQASGLTSVCINSTLPLTANASGAGPFTYAWTSSNNAIATVDNTGLVTGLAAGTVNITYTVTDVNGCASATSTAYSLTVIAIPTGTFTATENSGTTPNDNIICAGDNVTFAAPPGYSAYTFYVNGTKVLGPTTNNLFNTTTLNSGDKVTVNVANASNCGTTFGPITITVNQPPTPTLSADKTTICQGDMVTFTAGGGGVNSVYTFELNGSPVQSGASNIYTNNSLNNNDKVTVILTDANKCAATYATPIVITVNGLPSGTLTSNPNPAKVCAGGNITFTATSGFTTYEFFVSGVSQGVIGTNTFSSTTLLNGSIVTVKATNSTTCSNTFNAVPVTIYALPTGTLTVTENSGTANDYIICAGAPVTFTVTPTAGNTYSFYLNGIGSALQSGSSNKYTSTTLANGNYITVVVSNANSCQITLTSPAITVIQPPTGSLTASPSGPVCAGSSVTFTADAGYTNYNFKIGGTSAQNGPGNTFTSTSLADGNVVTVDVTGSNGCITTFGPITMHVNALPTGNLSIAETSGLANNDGIICTGATVVFTATSGFSNYNFLLNGSSIQNGSSNVYTTSSLNNNDKVTVTVTNASGCVALFNSYTITVNPLPTVAAITGTINVCVNSTTTLSDATSGGTWSSSDPTIATIDVTTGLVTGVKAGTVTILYTTAKDASGCTNSVSTTVTVNALPVVAAIGGLSDVCVNSTITLTDGTSGGTWSTGDGTIATVDGSGNVTGVANGTVTISYSVTNGNGCTTIINKTINVHALPVVSPITVNAPATSFDVCVSSNITLSDATSGGTWSSSATGIATINASTGLVTGIADGPATISYIVTDVNGCSATVTQVVNVHALPVPTLSGPNPICPGAVDIYTTETGQSNYNWLVTGGSFTGAGTSTITVTWNLSGPYSISVNYANSNGCFAATSVTVTGNTGTIPTISPDPAPAVCLNSDGSYSTQPGFANYTWAATGGTVTPGVAPNDNTATVNWTTPGTGSVSVNFADALGCVAATPTVLSVRVNPLPTVTTHDQTVCSPSTVDLTAAAVTSGSTAGLTYTYWTDAAATTAVVNPTAVGAGTYYIEGTTAAGCSSIQSVNVIVNPSPTVAVTNPGAVCSPATVDITASSVTAGSTSGLTFSYWTNAGATSAYGTPATAGAGTYYIKGTTSLGCSDIQPVTVTVNPTPTVVIANPAPVCSPATVDLTANAVTAGSTAGLTFTYYTDAAGTIALSNPNAVATSGTYYIKGTTAAGCSGVIKPVVVTVNPLPVVSITNPASVCAPGTVDLTASAVTAGSTNVSTYSYYTDAAGTITLSNPNAVATSGSYYIKGTSAAGCAGVIKSVIVTVNPLPVLSITNPAAVCSPVTVDLTASAVTAGSTNVSTYSYYTDAAGTITLSNPNAVATSGTYYIKGTSAAGCSGAIKPVVVTVTPAPTAVAGTPVSTCANSGAVNITAGSSATNQSSVLWTSSGTGTFTNANSLTTASYTPGAADITAGSVTLTLTANGNGSCAAVASTKTLTISAIPTISVVPVTATICQGSIQALTATSTGSPGPQTQTFTSGSINVSIPDATNFFGFTFPGEVNTPINISGIPAGAVITNITVSLLNVTETSDGDLNFNIKAPNGKILNLVNRRGGNSNKGFTNTSVTGNGVVSLATGSAPFTGTYAPDATTGIGPGGNTSNVTSFSSLASTPNGTWTLYAEDAVANGSSGAINSWSVKIDYTVPVSNPVTWSPVTALYTDAGATIPYTGQSLTTVYAQPSTSGTVVYTATATNASGCTNTAQTTLTVTPAPVVSISADYCLVSGKVVLTATSVPAATTYLWNTGGTKDTIQVNVANNYSVTVTAGGCPATGNITVAQNLVVNGDFSQGNVGFTSDYAYKPDLPGLVPAGQGELYDDSGNNGYSITPSGQNVHINFWGFDHTTESGIAPAGNFMAVNGHGNTLVVWKETVNVLPNTTYYFSAWAMSLNKAGNNAQLQFSVNGTLTGTTAVLANHCEGCAGGKANDNWTQFYGNWTSGPTTTTAVIYINDLQSALSGNDFGLDDINFGTLSPFIYLVSAPGTDAQTPCVNTAITPIVYSVGSTSFGPTISSPLPAGLTGTFTPGSGLYTITGTPTVAGNYTYTLTTTGSCNPTSATGTINIQSQTISLSSGNANPVQCKTALVNFGFTLGGTATGATATGLPVGVTGSTSGNTYTISGMPTDTAGVYHYSIVTTGGSCNPVTITGTITLQQQTITHNSGDSLQTVCVNTPIDNIQYTISGPGSLSGTVTGLPGGVSYTYNSGILIISGTPNAAGTFKYYITGSGGCANAKDSGVITVTPAAVLILTSGAPTAAQTICVTAPILDITYSLNNTTNATVDGLPAGVTGSVTGGVFTITGTPTEVGTFNYTVTTSGGCGIGTATGTITIQSQTIDLTTGNASPTLCQNTLMTPIVYTIGGTATGATLSGQPSGVNGVLSGNTFTVSGTPGVAGSFDYTVTVTGSCATNAVATGTITVQDAVAGGNIQLVSTAVCEGASASMTLMDQVGTIIGWETSVDGGTTWSGPNGNTTISENPLNVLVPTLWRVEVNNGCGTAYSAIATVSIHNLWTGANNTTDWNTGSNWSDGLVPSTSCPTVKVPVVAINKYPILSTGPVATITNLQIDAGASVTITGNTIQIAGTITNSGIFDVTNGTVELNGTATQNIDGKTFNNTIPGENNTVENLIISNNVNVANTPGDTLNITGTLSFGTGTAQLQTGDNITLKSSATATASVGVIGSSNAITGDITVERYSAAINNWQFLAIPTQTSQTINAAWQEGQAPGVIGPIGYGTNITGPVFANGLDFASPNPSMKYWDNATQAYINITGTNMTFPNIKNGFFLYIRGDRQATANAASPHIPTVMRTKGSLYKGAVSFNVPGNTYYSIGNPYASRVNFGNIIEATTAITAFYVWDPLIYGTRGAGGYQTLSAANNYWPTVPTAYYAASTPDPYLESGQATFVNNTTATGATLTFNESDKVNGSNLVFRGGDASVSRFLRTFLYNASGKVADGNVVAFNSKYQNKLDANDAVKISNTGENLGLKRDGIILAIEARAPVTASDTIYFNLKNVAKQTYRLGFNPENMQDAGVTAYLVDNYLKTTNEVSLAGATFADFTVNSDTGSYATGRFMIVFKKAVVLPVTFVSIKAAQKDKDIVVSWNVANENNMQEYDVEKSLDGNNFVKVATVTAINNGGGNYQWTDNDAVPGNNYYRIRSVDKNQKTVYSTVVNVLITNLKTGITIYPNPITDGIIHLQFINQPEGRYRISLFNSLGQLIVAKQIEYAGGNGSENIQWDYNLSHGIYQLEVRRPDGSVVIIKVLY